MELRRSSRRSVRILENGISIQRKIQGNKRIDERNDRNRQTCEGKHMRKYEELSQLEKEELDENELKEYIEYELMELGVAPEPPGKRPELCPHISTI